MFDALPPGLPRLISIGRLDITSEGLSLLTNDGGLARASNFRPAAGCAAIAPGRAAGSIQARLDALKDGLTVEGVRYGPIEASLDRPQGRRRRANLWLTLSLAEGKNREVRRVLEALGLTVNRLIRVAYGPFALDRLAAGAVEEVAPPAIRETLAHVIAPASLPTGRGPSMSQPSPWPNRNGPADRPRARRLLAARSRRKPSTSPDGPSPSGVLPALTRPPRPASLRPVAGGVALPRLIALLPPLRSGLRQGMGPSGAGPRQRAGPANSPDFTRAQRRRGVKARHGFGDDDIADDQGHVLEHRGQGKVACCGGRLQESSRLDEEHDQYVVGGVGAGGELNAAQTQRHVGEAGAHQGAGEKGVDGEIEVQAGEDNCGEAYEDNRPAG